MSQVQLIARHTIASGNEEQVYPLLDELIAASRNEPGNLAFDLYRKAGDPRSYVLLERYASREALAAHRQTRHFEEYMVGQILPLLESRAVEEYDVPE